MELWQLDHSIIPLFSSFVLTDWLFGQADFIGYAANPEYHEGLQPGAASQRLAKLRNLRVQQRYDAMQPLENGMAVGANGIGQEAIVLPWGYMQVEIRRHGVAKFEEFDFSPYNMTKFSGLENGIPSCYCNALLQVQVVSGLWGGAEFVV